MLLPCKKWTTQASYNFSPLGFVILGPVLDKQPFLMTALGPRGTLGGKDRVIRLILENLKQCAGVQCSSLTQLIPACEGHGQDLNLLVFSALCFLSYTADCE